MKLGHRKGSKMEELAKYFLQSNYLKTVYGIKGFEDFFHKQVIKISQSING